MAANKLIPREEAYHVLMSSRRNPENFQEEFALLKQKRFQGRHDLRLTIFLVSGTIKMQKRLDLILSKFLRKKLTSHSDSLLTVLRLGCFQLLPDSKIPQYAAVNETVNLAKKYTPGAEALTNAVLKNISQNIDKLTFEELRSDPVNYLAQYYSYPIWFVRELINSWPEQLVEKLLFQGNDASPLVIRLSPDQEAIKDYLGQLQRRGLLFKQGKFLKHFIQIISDINPTDIPGFNNGSFIIQNQASGLVVELLDPRPGNEVLDLCAAPGGKTTDIYSRMNGKGSITALDVSENRLKLLRENLERLKIEGVTVIGVDGRKFRSGTYDKILLDAPCSGSGVFRKYPESRWLTTQDDVNRLAVLQTELLENAHSLLKENGTLVYSTCSVLTTENELIIEKFLEKHPEFEAVIPDGFKHPDLLDDKNYLHTYPGLKFLDNMFAVCLKRK